MTIGQFILGSWSDFVTWTTLKMYDWLIDWFWHHQPATYLSPVQEDSVAGPGMFGHQRSMERKLEVGSDGLPYTRQPGFNLPQQWSLLNQFWTAQGHCGACKKKRNQAATDLGPCGKIQMKPHSVNSCPLTRLNGGLSQLHSADDEAVDCLISYGSWCIRKKK